MHLNQAARLYQAIAAEDDGTTGRTLATVCALNGLAAVSECRGDVDEAAKQYRLAAARAEGWLTATCRPSNSESRNSTGELREEILFAIPASPPTPATNPVTLPKGLSLPPLNLPPAPQKPAATPAATPAEVPPASPAPGAPKPQ